MWIKPLGLLYIGAMLREAGCDITLIDCLEGKEQPGNRKKESIYGCAKFLKEDAEKPQQFSYIKRKYSKYGISFDDFRSQLRSVDSPDYIFVTSVITYWYRGAIEAIKILREFFPDSKIVLGGKYAQICKDHAIKNSTADVVLKADNFIETIKEVRKVLNMDDISFPDFESDDFPYPIYDLYDDLKYVSILTSIGCPFKCTYCYTPLSDQNFKKRSCSSVVNEIQYWNQKYNVRNFAFYDDALNYKADERLIPILKEIGRSNLNIFLHTPNAINARWIDQKQADLMYEAGFKTIRLGFETSDSERQKKMGSKIFSDEFERGFQCLRNAGFKFDEIGAYLLAGIPGQKPKELKKDINYLISLGIKPYLAEYSPIPGTQMFNDAQEISRYDLNEPLYQNNSIFPMQNEEFSYEDMNEIKNYLKEKLKENHL